MMSSFDIFAPSPQGYEVHYPLEGEKVYGESLQLIARMLQDGFLVQVQATSFVTVI
jgi:hypothetical protein